jgi:hypothetical protein
VHSSPGTANSDAHRAQKSLSPRFRPADDEREPVSNIDHIAVGPGGVTVIDTKSYKGKVRVERVGGLFSPRREILKINGRDQTKLIVGAEKQIQYVESAPRATGHQGVDLRGDSLYD